MDSNHKLAERMQEQWRTSHYDRLHGPTELDDRASFNPPDLDTVGDDR